MKKRPNNKLTVVFVSNDFWAGCYVNNRLVYQGDDVNCSDKLLKAIFSQLPIITYKFHKITEEEYNKYFNSYQTSGYPDILQDFYDKITGRSNK